MTTPDAAALPGAIDALRSWQIEGGAVQLHPGDIGWFQRFGADRAAAAVRVWTGADGIGALAFLDGPDVLRLTTAPGSRSDRALAEAIAGELDGILPAGGGAVELPPDAALHDVLASRGWRLGEAWTPLSRDLSDPVPVVELDIVTVGPDEAAVRTAVHRAAFAKPTFTVERWHDLASGSAYADARCLVGLDSAGDAVAAITVWSAGPGRPGLIEPMGVHPDHRGHGHGTAITVAGAAALRELGSSSALVVTTSANTAAVATYKAAGFTALAERYDRTRD